jgi:hypothetical protein
VILLSSPDRHDRALAASEFAVPRLCDLSRSSAILSSADWAIACRIDGRATVGELARQSGIGLHDAVQRVTRLVRSGVCAIGAEAAPGHGDRWQPADVMAPLPRRVREVPRAVRPHTRPDLGLLQQVLDGLRALD